MELAVVVGHCTATIKESSLAGRKFALVQTAGLSGEPDGPLEAALDVTGAGTGQLVLLTRGSAARQPAENRQLAVDLSIVAIVDEITVARANGSPAPKTARRSVKKSRTAPTQVRRT